LEGILTVLPTREEAVTWMREYTSDNPGEVLRIIDHYPM